MLFKNFICPRNSDAGSNPAALPNKGAKSSWYKGVKDMNDYISKSSVCEILANIYPTDGEKVVSVKVIDKAYEEILQLTSTEPEQQWIPCSERLPKRKDETQMRGYYLTTNAYGSVGLTKYEFEGGGLGFAWDSDIRIVAWMPLPEPYKEK